MAYVRVLREVEVMDEASGGDDGLRHVCHAEALEARRAEMLHEPLLGRLRGVDPVVHLEDGAAVAHGKLVGLARALHPQHLLGGDVGDELLDVFRLPARTQELARGYVEEGHAREMLPLVYASEEIVLAARKHRVRRVDAGRDELRDAPLHELPGELRVFELFAYRHAPPCADELGR